MLLQSHKYVLSARQSIVLSKGLWEVSWNPAMTIIFQTFIKLAKFAFTRKGFAWNCFLSVQPFAITSLAVPIKAWFTYSNKDFSLSWKQFKDEKKLRSALYFCLSPWDAFYAKHTKSTRQLDVEQKLKLHRVFLVLKIAKKKCEETLDFEIILSKKRLRRRSFIMNLIC